MHYPQGLALLHQSSMKEKSHSLASNRGIFSNEAPSSQIMLPCVKLTESQPAYLPRTTEKYTQHTSLYVHPLYPFPCTFILYVSSAQAQPINPPPTHLPTNATVTSKPSNYRSLWLLPQFTCPNSTQCPEDNHLLTKCVSSPPTKHPPQQQVMRILWPLINYIKMQVDPGVKQKCRLDIMTHI